MRVWKAWKSRGLALLALFGVLLTLPAQLAAYAQVVTCGSVVRISWTVNDGGNNVTYYLAANADVENSYPGGDKAGYAVYGITDPTDQNCWWIIKGTFNSLNAQNQWGGTLPLGSPLLQGNWVRLENYASGYTLRANSAYTSPAKIKDASMGEVSVLTPNGGAAQDANGQSAEFDYQYFCLCSGWNNNGTGGIGQTGYDYLYSGQTQFLGNPLGWFFRCYPAMKYALGQQIDIHGNPPGDGAGWPTYQLTLSVVMQPHQVGLRQDLDTTAIKDLFQSQRGGALLYRTPVWVDNIYSGYAAGQRQGRCWAAAPSWQNPNGENSAPNNPWQVLLGFFDISNPNDSAFDPRVRTATSFFMIENADDPGKTGAVQWGDKIRILSLYATKNMPSAEIVFKEVATLPFHYLALVSNWTNSNTFQSVLAFHPDHQVAKSSSAIWVMEPAVKGLTGSVCQLDCIMLRNQGSNANLGISMNNWPQTAFELDGNGNLILNGQGQPVPDEYRGILANGSVTGYSWSPSADPASPDDQRWPFWTMTHVDPHVYDNDSVAKGMVAEVLKLVSEHLGGVKPSPSAPAPAPSQAQTQSNSQTLLAQQAALEQQIAAQKAALATLEQQQQSSSQTAAQLAAAQKAAQAKADAALKAKEQAEAQAKLQHSKDLQALAQQAIADIKKAQEVSQDEAARVDALYRKKQAELEAKFKAQQQAMIEVVEAAQEREKKQEAADQAAMAAKNAAANQRVKNALAQAKAQAEAELQAAKDALVAQLMRASGILGNEQAQINAEKKGFISQADIAAAKAKQAADKAKIAQQYKEMEKRRADHAKFILAAEAMSDVEMPLAFHAIPGKGLAKICAYLVDEERTETVSSNVKKKVKTYHTAGYALTDDGKLLRYRADHDSTNPWVEVVIKTSGGSEEVFGDVAGGFDGTVYAISKDGRKTYKLVRSNKAPQPPADPSKGAAASQAVAAQRQTATVSSTRKAARERRRRRRQRRRQRRERRHKGEAAQAGASQSGAEESGSVEETTTVTTTKNGVTSAPVVSHSVKPLGKKGGKMHPGKKAARRLDKAARRARREAKKNQPQENAA